MKRKTILKGLKPYRLYKHKTVSNGEGGVFESFSDTPFLITANIWCATGKVQAEMYGTRLNYILNMLCYSDVDIKEKDGVAVYTQDKPDYKVISLKRWTNHLQIELEMIRGVN